jgi:hypothetical protein
MAWYKYAKPGDKILCVNAELKSVGTPSKLDRVKDLDGLREKCVYTVKWIGPDPVESNILCVFIREITRPGIDGEYGYAVDRFRPIQPKSTETGMKVFQGILNGQRVPETPTVKENA